MAVRACIVIAVNRVWCVQKIRIARLMRKAQLRSVRGYKRLRYRAGMPSTTAPNRLQ